ncbi:MAG TPA: hypothetical protein VFI31_24420 [Pirellulales bacterium]|nr:hypothetical protein [Pirellulales bacterium]
MRLLGQITLFMLFVATAAAAPTVVKSKATAKAPTSFQAVKTAVEAHFKKITHYRPGDLITRGDAQAVFEELARLGWKAPDQGKILEQLLADDDELVRALRASEHLGFMRQMGQTPNGYGYDRLDRLSRMEDGRTIVNRLMEEPGGWNFIDIMAETREGPGLAQAFSMGPGGKDFTKPTGRIYTEAQLIARLKQSYDKTSKKTR